MDVRHREKRSGNVLVFSAFLMVVLFTAIAFAVDVGYLYVVRSELQRAADATALAGAWSLWEAEQATDTVDPAQSAPLADAAAGQYAAANPVGGKPLELSSDDVVVGYLQPDNTVGPDPTAYVAVRTQLNKTANQNGAVPFFFARVLGLSGTDQTAHATAAFINNFSGWGTPTSGKHLKMLPFALDEGTYEEMRAGVGDDDWAWNEDLGQIQQGSDCGTEVNLFPQSTGAPGNRGTVDIGNTNNSTNDIRRQILEGISAEDLAYHGGKLEFNDAHELYLNGDTGISAGVKAQLEQIKGEPRIIPIFRSVCGPGNNAWYTIVKFGCVRIMDVKLTGPMSTKRVIIQPAKITCAGGIPGTGETTSYGIYSPVWLVR